MIWQEFEIEAGSNEEAIAQAQTQDCEPIGNIDFDFNSEQVLCTEVLTEEGEEIYSENSPVTN